MRAVILLSLAATLAIASPTAAAPAGSGPHAAFELAIERTKKAMMGDPEAALASAKQAVEMARRLPASQHSATDTATADWLHGEALIFLNRLDAATPIIKAALARVERTAPNTKLHGDLLRSHGALMWMAGKVQPALDDYQRAHDVFARAGEPRSRAMALEDLGRIYWDAGDYNRTLAYYNQSAEAFSGDAALRLTQQNNRGEVFRKLNRNAEAVAAYRSALAEAKKLRSVTLQVRILTNLAEAEADAGNLPLAELAARQALMLTERGDAAGLRPFVYGAAARIDAKQGQFESAATLIAKTFANVDLTKTDISFREYHATASDVYERLGDTAKALAHARAFQRLEGDTQQLTASAASQLMAARFDFANQDLKISKLKQDQLRRDVEAEREQSRFRTILFTALIAAGAFVVGVLLFAYNAARRGRDAVRAANESLTTVNEELEKAIKAKTEFLATTSHEIRTPLNGILGMTQVLLADRKIDPTVRERIEVVHGAGETMKALVDDILDVAKIESGELRVVHEPTELGRILDDAARLWSGQAQAKGLELVRETSGCPRWIVSDEGRMRQIVFNLMSNALKFTQQGSVTLFAGTGKAADGTDTLVLRVTDTGIGIPADKQAEIFEAFRQVDSGTTRQFGGTGLGLAICRQLAHALGGDIAVESTPGQGASFTVTLALEVVADASDAVQPGSDQVLAPVKFLLVEANPLNQTIMRLMLAAEAGSVRVTDSASTALAALEEEDVTHLVVDTATITADRDDPLAALRDVIAAARTAGAHCSLLLAPDAAGITVAEAMMVGATQLIVKPIGADDLMVALRSLYSDDPESFVAPALLDARAA